MWAAFEIPKEPDTTPSPRRLQHGARPSWKEDASREIGASSKYSGLTRLAYHYNREFSASQHHAYGCNCMMLGDRPLLETTFGPPVDELDATCKKLKECYRCVLTEFGGTCTPENRIYDFFVRGQDVLPGNRAGSCERAIFECDHHYAKQLTSTISHFDMRFNFFVSGFDPISEPSICALAHSAAKESSLNQAQAAAGPIQMSVQSPMSSPAIAESSPTFGSQPTFAMPSSPAQFVLESSDRPLFLGVQSAQFTPPTSSSSSGSSFGGVREIVQPHNMQCCGGPESPYMIYDANMKKCCSDGTVRSVC